MPAASSRRPRVLHVFGALSVGGAESWLLQALPRADELEWELEAVLLAEREGRLAGEFRRRGYAVRSCPFRPAWSFPLRFIRCLRRGGFDAVHSHVCRFSGVVCFLAAAAGVPLRIAHAHNDSDGKGRGWARRIYGLAMSALLDVSAAHVFACTRRAGKTLTASEDRIRVIPYGVDLARFRSSGDRRSARAALGAAEGDRVVGHCGRLTAQKNQTFLLDVFAAALERAPSLLLMIAGEGELRDELAAHARALGVADRVRFLGLRDDAPRLMTDVFDAFALPSLHEGLPVALLEAQAAGLPCLASERVNPETIVDPARVSRLALDAGLDVWADALAASAGAARGETSEAAGRIRAAGFDAGGSRRRLLEAYEAVRRSAAAGRSGAEAAEGAV